MLVEDLYYKKIRNLTEYIVIVCSLPIDKLDNVATILEIAELASIVIYPSLHRLDLLLSNKTYLEECHSRSAEAMLSIFIASNGVIFFSL